MMAMKTDMTGAAIVMAAISIASRLGARGEDHGDRADDREPAE